MSIEPLLFSHIATPYRCYPGDRLNFSTRVEFLETFAKDNLAKEPLRLEVDLPIALQVASIEIIYNDQQGNVITLNHANKELIRLSDTLNHHHQTCRWKIEPIVGQFDIEIYTQVSSDIIYNFHQRLLVPNDEIGTNSEADTLSLTSLARLKAITTGAILHEQEIGIVISRQAALLHYLPAIYEQDTYLNQFLMLIESFTKPIQQQIGQMEHFLDPLLTPKEHIPWLASWFDWEFEEDWHSERQALKQERQEEWQRRMIPALWKIHRLRGTEEGLQLYLQEYLGLSEKNVKIQSYPLHGLKLGKDAKLGKGIALYSQARQPHSFSISLTLPLHLASIPNADALIKSKVRQIVAREKPAHTSLADVIVEFESLMM